MTNNIEKFGPTSVDNLREASGKALALLERNAVTIDGEWGDCRSLEELERDGALPEEILGLRKAIADYDEALNDLIEMLRVIEE